jgi:diaminopimelate epimerase
MSGAGNDFLVLGPDEAQRIGDGLVEWVRRVSRRGVSVGADGVLVVEPQGDGRIRVLFLNPDGSEAFCGNGSRCAARFARLRDMAGDTMVLDTRAGDVRAEVSGDRVSLTVPPPRDLGSVAIDVGATALDGRWIDAGCPHFVAFVDDPSAAPLERWGPVVRRDPAFAPDGVNVNLVARDGDRLAVRTFERGVEGETLACGSGAIAAAFAARLQGAGETVDVMPASGIALRIRLPGSADRPEEAGMEGDARVLFEARIGPEATRGF